VVQLQTSVRTVVDDIKRALQQTSLADASLSFPERILARAWRGGTLNTGILMPPHFFPKDPPRHYVTQWAQIEAEASKKATDEGATPEVAAQNALSSISRQLETLTRSDQSGRWTTTVLPGVFVADPRDNGMGETDWAAVVAAFGQFTAAYTNRERIKTTELGALPPSANTSLPYVFGASLEVILVHSLIDEPFRNRFAGFVEMQRLINTQLEIKREEGANLPPPEQTLLNNEDIARLGMRPGFATFVSKELRVFDGLYRTLTRKSLASALLPRAVGFTVGELLLEVCFLEEGAGGYGALVRPMNAQRSLPLTSPDDTPFRACVPGSELAEMFGYPSAGWVHYPPASQ
jgi:hypothetical protein